MKYHNEQHPTNPNMGNGILLDITLPNSIRCCILHTSCAILVCKHQNKFMQFIEALHAKLPHQARMNYTTMHMDTYFVYWHVQINLDVYTVWCNNMDNPASWGWDRN